MIKERYLVDLVRRDRLNRAANLVSWFLYGSRWRIKSSECYRV